MAILAKWRTRLCPWLWCHYLYYEHWFRDSILYFQNTRVVPLAAVMNERVYLFCFFLFFLGFRIYKNYLHVFVDPLSLRRVQWPMALTREQPLSSQQTWDVKLTHVICLDEWRQENPSPEHIITSCEILRRLKAIEVFAHSGNCISCCLPFSIFDQFCSCWIRLLWS